MTVIDVPSMWGPNLRFGPRFLCWGNSAVLQNFAERVFLKDLSGFWERRFEASRAGSGASVCLDLLNGIYNQFS